jgi:AraC-like DNA-binding protein
MRKTDHSFDADPNLGKVIVEVFKGKIQNNFANGLDDIYTGTRYFLNCGRGVDAVFINVEYNQDAVYRNNSDADSIAIFCDLTVGDANLNINGSIYQIGKWNYDLLIVDGSVKSEYIVKKGNKTLALCIYLSKEVMKEYLSRRKSLNVTLNEMIDSNENSIIKFGKIGNDLFFKLKELQKKDSGTMVFNLYMTAMVNFLLSECIDKIEKEQNDLQTIDEHDFALILNTQKYLFDNCDKLFPSIEVLAKNANMSVTKFKCLFKKITNSTPNSFYLDCKFIKAKHLLDERSRTVTQISDLLNFNGISYFSSMFKKKFGISPKIYLEK